MNHTETKSFRISHSLCNSQIIPVTSTIPGMFLCALYIYCPSLMQILFWCCAAAVQQIAEKEY